MEAFVYCWSNKTNEMKYVGYHKGELCDGYVASGKKFLLDYEKNPQNFTRQIIAEGSIEDMHSLETAILRSVKAGSNPEYYNMHSNNGNIIGHMNDDVKKKISVSKTGVKRSIKSCRKQAKSITGNNNHFYNKNHTESTRLQMSLSKKGKRTRSTAKPITVIYKDGTREKYDFMMDCSKALGISKYLINKKINDRGELQWV